MVTTVRPARRAPRAWTGVVAWGLAFVCGIVILVLVFGSVTTPSRGGGAVRPISQCGSIASPGPDYNSEGGDCTGALEERRLEVIAMAVGGVVFAIAGLERAVRRRRGEGDARSTRTFSPRS